MCNISQPQASKARGLRRLRRLKFESESGLAGNPAGVRIAGCRWNALTVVAEDGLGGLYLGNFGGSHSRPGHQEVKLPMRPPPAPGPGS
jgi:hypothetical protein